MEAVLTLSDKGGGTSFWVPCLAEDAALQTICNWRISLKAAAPVFVVTRMKTEF